MLSMTGFGRNEYFDRQLQTTVITEISSINRKQLEIRLNLPAEYSFIEIDIRQLVSNFFSRGAIQIKVQLHRNNNVNSTLNTDLLDQLISAAVEARRRIGLPVEHTDVERLFFVDGVFGADNSASNEHLKDTILKSVELASANCREMRQREGANLLLDLRQRCSILQDIYKKLQLLSCNLPEIAKKRLSNKLQQENLLSDPHDPNFLRELLFYADHSDVTEELTRLGSHFQQLERFFNDTEPCGRSLDFLMQEFFREITTTGNKAACPDISPLVVKFKSELEKMREQIQNVE